MINNFNMRPAFSMITAIFVIVIMASVASFVMNLSAKTLQETITQYQKEQAMLYAKSYTEFAIMSATARDCIQSIDTNISTPLTGDGYWVHLDIQYLGNGLNASGCANTIGGVISTANSQGGTILIDTYVRYKNIDVPNIAASPWVTYHRRSLQRL